jgi:hypothetical protein
MRRVLLWFLMGAGLAGPIAAQRQRDLLYGAQVRVLPRSSGGPPVTGELVAVSDDTLWMLAGPRLVALPMPQVAQVRIDRRTAGPGRAWAWALIGGACSSVGNGHGCGGAFVVSVALFLVPGAIAAASLDHARYQTLDRPEAGLLRARARFPQGLPQGVDRDSLTRGLP